MFAWGAQERASLGLTVVDGNSGWSVCLIQESYQERQGANNGHQRWMGKTGSSQALGDPCETMDPAMHISGL